MLVCASKLLASPWLGVAALQPYLFSKLGYRILDGSVEQTPKKIPFAKNQSPKSPKDDS
jgi:hypothetical protein